MDLNLPHWFMNHPLCPLQSGWQGWILLGRANGYGQKSKTSCMAKFWAKRCWYLTRACWDFLIHTGGHEGLPHLWQCTHKLWRCVCGGADKQINDVIPYVQVLWISQSVLCFISITSASAFWPPPFPRTTVPVISLQSFYWSPVGYSGWEQ